MVSFLVHVQRSLKLLPATTSPYCASPISFALMTVSFFSLQNMPQLCAPISSLSNNTHVCHYYQMYATIIAFAINNRYGEIRTLLSTTSQLAVSATSQLAAVGSNANERVSNVRLVDVVKHDMSQ